ncbi:MAG: lipid-A-disaccharide synthase [Victivallales bacterium]|nr:lipid-A-disaccharide synthase [Victivallales bacterium]
MSEVPAQSKPLTCWIVAGEASGDAYGAALATALQTARPGIRLAGMGAGKMRAAGVETYIDSTELGIVGFVEVIKHLPMFLRLFRELVRRAAAELPSAVVLIDYPGFNLRLAKKLHALGIRVVWYISPQVWAWKRGRIWKLAKYCSRMLCIFPFEPQCYAPTTLSAEFIGHPLFEQLNPMKGLGIQREENLVLLLPGSRRQEIQRLLPDFVNAACLLHRRNPALRFEFATPRPAIQEYAQAMLAKMNLPEDAPEFSWRCGQTRERMLAANAAVAASGTVTVEAAMLGLPVVVAYRLGALSWWIGRRLVKLPSITIANLVCETTVFEEFLQDDCTPVHLADAAERILPGGARRGECLRLLDEFTRRLGSAEAVSPKVAKIVLEECQKSASQF